MTIKALIIQLELFSACSSVCYSSLSFLHFASTAALTSIDVISTITGAFTVIEGRRCASLASGLSRLRVKAARETWVWPGNRGSRGSKAEKGTRLSEQGF